MAESSSNHGEGLEIRVILLQFPCLSQKRTTLCYGKQQRRSQRLYIQMRNQTYEQQSEHGLSDIEAVPPVVIGDVTVSPADGVHPTCQDLHRRSKTEVQ